MIFIELTQDQRTVVDPSTYEWAGQFKWYALKDCRTFYAARKIITPAGRGVSLLHREILKATDGQLVDHIDNDGLNNVKSNLRLCSDGQNARNARLRTDNATGFKGVSFSARLNKFQAEISFNGRKLYLGVFLSAVEAAHARDAAALKFHGEFAWLNFPEKSI